MGSIKLFAFQKERHNTKIRKRLRNGFFTHIPQSINTVYVPSPYAPRIQGPAHANLGSTKYFSRSITVDWLIGSVPL